MGELPRTMAEGSAHPDAGAHDDGRNDDQQAAVEAVGDGDEEGAELSEDAEHDEEGACPNSCRAEQPSFKYLQLCSEEM